MHGCIQFLEHAIFCWQGNLMAGVRLRGRLTTEPGHTCPARVIPSMHGSACAQHPLYYLNLSDITTRFFSTCGHRLWRAAAAMPAVLHESVELGVLPSLTCDRKDQVGCTSIRSCLAVRYACKIVMRQASGTMCLMHIAGPCVENLQ